ncbi:Rossmann-like domain-containing protein [Desulfotruncus arcticus]|uniref:Rossmann-like domain-containing protein n=1 Tax=Desulfotruncus arcticus TaxID=341036 RepID=UPI000AAC7C98|nr:DUF364 domain-containing protein [Desulfotruncus arcticus]
MDPSTLKPDEMPFYAHGDKAAEIVPQADVLVITGTTLINDTLEGLLKAAKPGAHTTMTCCRDKTHCWHGRTNHRR